MSQWQPRLLAQNPTTVATPPGGVLSPMPGALQGASPGSLPGALQGASPAGQAPGKGGVSLPHDIRGALPWHITWWQILALVAAAALLIAAGVALERWWRRRQAAKPLAQRDPWDVLADRLATLQPSPTFALKEQEDFFYALSLLLREAIERRSGIAATDLTWQELRQPLRQKLPMAPETTEAVLSLLERADYIKFGGVPSTVQEANAATAQVRGWLALLRPAPSEPGQIEGLPWQEAAPPMANSLTTPSAPARGKAGDHASR